MVQTRAMRRKADPESTKLTESTSSSMSENDDVPKAKPWWPLVRWSGDFTYDSLQNVQSTPYGRFGNGPAMTMPLDPKVGGWAFPLLLNVQKGTKNFDLSIALGSWMVTSVHATLNAWWFSTYGKHLSKGGGWAWLKSTQFRVGALMYYSGLAARSQW
eukprot:g4558.t1